MAELHLDDKRDRITVCICTYRRLKLLGELLKGLEGQKTEGLFAYSIVIVDNDCGKPSESLITNIRKKSLLEIDYYCEPEQNISMARNRAVQNAKGNLVAFIDDDEFPESNWLLILYKAYMRYNVDGVLGPVRPRFESKPPEWVAKGRLCERESFETGRVLIRPSHTRTGNALLSKTMFDKEKTPFDPRYGRTGGEDVDFFRRMMRKNYKFAWCNEAVVYEVVPAERLSRAYFLKRAILQGTVNSKSASSSSLDTLKSVIALFVYAVILPFSFVAGHHLFMRCLISSCGHLGKILGFFGIEPVKDRNFY
jgi:glycosyltransferase involved in cell wall biosynthesis